MALIVQLRYVMVQTCPKLTAPQIVGSNITARRRSLGLTQEELGRAIQYSRRQIGRIERGEASLPAELLPIVGTVLKLNNPLILMQEEAFEQWI